MDLKLMKLQLFYNYSAKTLLLRIFLFGTAMAVVPCFLFVRDLEASRRCESWKFPLPLPLPIQMFSTQDNTTVETVFPLSNVLKASVFTTIFQDLIDKNWLYNGNRERALCVGPNSAQAVMALRKLGLKSAIGVDKRACSSLVRRGDVYDLPYPDETFDFVFTRAMDGVRIPARLVLEMERVLKPGKVGVVLRRVSGRFPANLVKMATPVSTFLKLSDVIHVRNVNCSSAMVVFRKRSGEGLVPELVALA